MRSDGSSEACTTLSREGTNLISSRLIWLLVAAVGFAAAIAYVYPDRAIHAWSIGTAYSSFFLIAWALCLGPVNVIRGDANPVHSPLRRDVGIAGGVIAVVHTVIGLQVHMGGQLSRYFLLQPVMHKPDVLFLAANWIGLVSTLLLTGLVTISNNPSLRRLGLETWKFFQRWAYPAAALVVLHGVAFQLLEKRSKPLMALVLVITLVVVGLQLKGRSIKLHKAG